MASIIYGVRNLNHLTHVIVKAASAERAANILHDGDVIVVSRDDGETWERARIQIVAGEIRNYETAECDDCGKGLILPGWLCYDCGTDRGLR